MPGPWQRIFGPCSPRRRDHRIVCPVEAHPFAAAWETRDVDAWADALAPGVVLHSPIISKPFQGREAVAELYGVLFDVLGRMEITDAFTTGDAHAFYWRADIGRRQVEGTDLLRHDDQGRVSEIRVMIRPLVDLATFAAAAGPPLAARRGRLRGLLLGVLTLPLRAMLGLADAIASRLALR
jgi:SnoaL-like domain